ncbi:MAG: hypothetical protein ACREO9_04450 [Lysobacterales bacterium]
MKHRSVSWEVLVGGSIPGTLDILFANSATAWFLMAREMKSSLHPAGSHLRSGKGL